MGNPRLCLARTSGRSGVSKRARPALCWAPGSEERYEACRSRTSWTSLAADVGRGAGRAGAEHGRPGRTGDGIGDLCPDLVNGCPDNRVVLVDPFGHIVWQYGVFGVTGSGADQLNTPVQATWLPNGHILIADENNNRAIEVTHDNAKTIVATFSAGGTASGVAFASRLPNGNTLLTDSNNSRIVEVNSHDQPVWQYFTNDPAGNSAPLPTRAVQLRDGEILISDQFNDRVIEVVPTGALGGTIERQLGTLNVFGIGNGLLDAPYDAKVIGDYTGLTPPFFFPFGD
jgi:outer membrane protein assembly factor BamB